MEVPKAAAISIGPHIREASDKKNVINELQKKVICF